MTQKRLSPRVIIVLTAALTTAACHGGVPSAAASLPTPYGGTTSPSTAGSTPPPPSPTVTPASAQTSLPVAPAPTVNLRTVDWLDTTYPVTCFDGKATLVKVVHGNGHAHGYDVSVSAPFYGSLGRRHAALVREACTGAGSSPDAILAFVDGGPAPQFIGYLLTTDENSYVKDVSFHGGAVSITSYAVSPQGSMASPDLLVTSRWTVDAHMKPTERAHDVEPNPDNPDAQQQAAQAYACSELDQVESAIRNDNALKMELSGGSVEGVPTWSESEAFGNMSQISAINWQLLRLHEVQPELQQACQTGNVSAD